MSEVSGNHYSAAIVKGQGAIQPLYQSGLREYCSFTKKKEVTTKKMPPHPGP